MTEKALQQQWKNDFMENMRKYKESEAAFEKQWKDAILHDDIQELDMLAKSGRMGAITWEYAVNRGKLNIIKWASENLLTPEYKQFCAEIASEVGNVEMLEYLNVVHHVHNGHEICTNALRTGNVHVLKYIHERGDIPGWDEDHDGVIKADVLDSLMNECLDELIMKYLIERMGYPFSVMRAESVAFDIPYMVQFLDRMGCQQTI